MRWLAHFFGLDNLSGAYYGFWSGVAGDVSLFAILAVIYRRLNCHVDGCWRIGHHHVEGKPYIVCKKHHPDVPGKITKEHIRRAK